MIFQTLTEARKQLSTKGLREVHLRAVAKVKELKAREFELIELLQELDDKKVYRFAGFNSLFNYCVQALELSEHQACEYIAVAQKAKEFPKLKEALKDQEITVTKARRVAAVITPENQEQWLKVARVSSKRELEKAIAGHSPRAVYHETSRYVSSNLLQVQLIMDEETLALIKRAQDLLSQSYSTSVSMGQAAKEVFGEFVERRCPVKKAERAQKRKLSGPGQVPEQVKVPSQKSDGPNNADRGNKSDRRRFYSQALLHQIMLRDQSQCTYQDPKGHRCPERRWLEIHHLKPLSRGGTNHLTNLRLLCRGHHQLTHSLP